MRHSDYLATCAVGTTEHRQHSDGRPDHDRLWGAHRAAAFPTLGKSRGSGAASASSPADPRTALNLNAIAQSPRHHSHNNNGNNYGLDVQALLSLSLSLPLPPCELHWAMSDSVAASRSAQFNSALAMSTLINRSMSIDCF